MSSVRPVILASILGGLSLSTIACSDLGTHTLIIQASEAVAVGVLTDDGWDVTFTSMVVVIHDPGLIERLENQPTWVREQGSTVWDVNQTLEDSHSLTRMIRATRYDGVDFRIAPTSNSDYEPIAGNVDESVVDEAIAGGWSIHVVGTATDAADVTITFDWTFDTSTLYRCPLGETALELDADGDETTVIEILGEALIRDVETGSITFAAIAAADVDQDGNVTNTELETAGLSETVSQATRRIGGVGSVGLCSAIDPRPNG